MLISMLLFAQATGRIFRCSTVVSPLPSPVTSETICCFYNSRFAAKNQSVTKEENAELSPRQLVQQPRKRILDFFGAAVVDRQRTSERINNIEAWDTPLQL